MVGKSLGQGAATIIPLDALPWRRGPVRQVDHSPSKDVVEFYCAAASRLASDQDGGDPDTTNSRAWCYVEKRVVLPLRSRKLLWNHFRRVPHVGLQLQATRAGRAGWCLLLLMGGWGEEVRSP